MHGEGHAKVLVADDWATGRKKYFFQVSFMHFSKLGRGEEVRKRSWRTWSKRMKAEWIRGVTLGEGDELRNKDKGTSPVKHLCVLSVLLFIYLWCLVTA